MSAETLPMSSNRFKLLYIPSNKIDRKLVLKNPIIKEGWGIPKYPDYQFLESCDLVYQSYQNKRLILMEAGIYKRGAFLDLDFDQETLREIYGYTIPKEEILDVYNITAPFKIDKKEIIAGRLQSKDNNYHSSVAFFEKSGKKWVPLKASIQNLEDPFFSNIHGRNILGGVRIYKGKDKNLIDLETLFFEISDLENIKLLSRGPSKMKDIRLVEMGDKIGLFSRPQGEIGARGQIGFIPLDSLEQVTLDTIIGAPLIPLQFPPYQWGGINEAHFENGQVLALGHRAFWDQEYELKRYYPWMFTLDPRSGECEDLGIIASRDDFPNCEARAADLPDVVFPGGIKKLKDGSLNLYVGVSDTKSGVINIPDPTVK